MKLLIGAIALMTIGISPEPTPAPATCKPLGQGTCTACSSCSSCKNCSKQGGSCSVCAGGPSRPPAAAPPRTPIVVPLGIASTARVDYHGRVISVQDGDTLTILSTGNEFKIRLFGIDAPENGQAFGNVSKKYLTEIALNKYVGVEKRDVDRYKRIVGIVRLDRRNLNADMVEAGLAWWYPKYAPKETGLKQLEAQARSQKKGLWYDAHPIPPWEWRKADVEELADCCAQ